MSAETPAGWYPAPDASDLLRYWDGEMWTEQARPAPARQAGPNMGMIGNPTLAVQNARVVLDALEPGERIEAGFSSFTLRSSYFVATGSRVLVVKRVGLRKREIHSIGYEEIDSIGISGMGYLTITVGDQKYSGTSTSPATLTDFLTFVRHRQPRPGSIDLATLPAPTVEGDVKQSETTEDDTLPDQLLQLAQLHSAGALTDDEFAAAKAKLLST